MSRKVIKCYNRALSLLYVPHTALAESKMREGLSDVAGDAMQYPSCWLFAPKERMRVCGTTDVPFEAVAPPTS